MAEGWYLVAFIILVVFIVIKIITKKQSAVVALTFFMFVFAALSVGYIVISNNLNFEGPGDFVEISKTYYSWILTIFDNTKVLTGNAIELDWTSNNAENRTQVEKDS